MEGRNVLSALITGHGQFAGGLYGALTMIAGEQENFEVQPFEESMGLDEFKKIISQKVRSLSENGKNQVFIFTDLKGGTPFNAATVETFEMPNARVCAGTNLPMLIEFCGCRLTGMTDEEFEEVEKKILVAARDGLLTQKPYFAPKDEENDEEEDEIEGI
jgi:PTS system N-acetylgalactosamine-specific IIA component